MKKEAFQFSVVYKGTDKQAIEFKYLSDPAFTNIPIPELTLPADDMDAEYKALMDKLIELEYIEPAKYSLDQNSEAKNQV